MSSHATTDATIHLTTLEGHNHGVGKVYPTGAAGVTVTAGAGAWTIGAFAEIVPASTIGDEYDIHYISVENLSDNGVYELVLYYGASDTECGRVRFSKNAVQDGTVNAPFMTPLIPADSRLRAKIMSSAANATADISVMYHEY